MSWVIFTEIPMIRWNAFGEQNAIVYRRCSARMMAFCFIGKIPGLGNPQRNP